jgi:hypothetical protein
MMNASDYALAWSLYLLACAVVMFTVWGLSARFWSWIKDPLRAVTAVLLLTPGSVDADGNFLAPAIFIVAFELLTAEEGGIGPLLGVRLLLFVIIAVLVAWVLRALWYWLGASRRPKAAPRAGSDRPTRGDTEPPEPRVTQLRAVDVRDRSTRRGRS